MLTGKAKELFEDYLIERELELDHLHEEDLLLTDWFFTIHFSFQWGVYQDFADSLGIGLLVYRLNKKHIVKYGYDIIDYNGKGSFNSGHDARESLNEAMAKAIEKLNEIINDEQD